MYDGAGRKLRSQCRRGEMAQEKEDHKTVTAPPPTSPENFLPVIFCKEKLTSFENRFKLLPYLLRNRQGMWAFRRKSLR